ncbi:MAG: hypothetical protein WAO61_00560, partial [Solirubrobacterales bacterium]
MSSASGVPRSSRLPRDPAESDFATPAGSAGLAEQASQLADGAVSSSELVERSLARIDATQPTLNAFRRVLHDGARAAAAAADRRL